MSAEKKEVMPNVQQIHPDAYGFMVEPHAAALTLATRFHPYRDGTSQTEALPVLVVRAHPQFLRAMCNDILKHLNEIDAKVAALQAQQLEAQQQAAVKANLSVVPTEDVASAD